MCRLELKRLVENMIYNEATLWRNKYNNVVKTLDESLKHNMKLIEISELLEQSHKPYVIQDVFYYHRFGIKFMRVITVYPEYRQTFYIDFLRFIKIPKC